MIVVIKYNIKKFIIFETGKEKLGFSKEEELVIVTADDGTEVEADIFIMKSKVPRDNIEDVQTIKKGVKWPG